MLIRSHGSFRPEGKAHVLVHPRYLDFRDGPRENMGLYSSTTARSIVVARNSEGDGALIQSFPKSLGSPKSFGFQKPFSFPKNLGVVLAAYMGILVVVYGSQRPCCLRTSPCNTSVYVYAYIYIHIPWGSECVNNTHFRKCALRTHFAKVVVF